MDTESTKVLRLVVKEEVTTRFRQVQKEMDGLQRKTDQTTRGMSDLFRQLSPVGLPTTFAAGVGTAISLIGVRSIRAASDLTELDSKARIVFGQTFPMVQARTREIAEEVGRASSAVLKFSTDMGAVINAFGFTGPLLDDMSTRMAKLAVDMASFHNASDDQAFMALRSGITGETEPLKRFGIVLTDTNLKVFALSKGIKTKVESMNQAQKTALRYSFIMEQTKLAQGDAARTAESFANQSRRLSGEIRSLNEEMGKSATPVLADAIGGLTDIIQSSRISIRGWIGDVVAMRELISNGIQTYAPGLVNLFNRTGPAGESTFSNSIDLNSGAFGQPGGGVGGFVPPAADLGLDPLKDFASLGGVTGAGGGGGGEDAKKKLEQIREAMADLGKTVRRETFDINNRIRELDRTHRDSLEDIRKQMGDTSEKISDLREEHAKLAESWERDVQRMNRSTADLLIGSDDKLAGFADQIAEIERQMEVVKQAGGSVSVDVQERYDKLLADQAKEEAGRANVAGQAGVGVFGGKETREVLESKLADERRKLEDHLRERQAILDRGGSVGVGLTQSIASRQGRIADLTGQLGVGPSEADKIYTERSGQTDIERRYADLKEEQSQRDKEHEERVAELNESQQDLLKTMTELTEKRRQENETYTQTRQQLEMTRSSIQTFDTDYGAAMGNITAVTDDTVNGLKSRFEEMQTMISQIDALVAARSDLTGGGTVAERVADRRAARVDERASGGPASGWTIVGEQGPELISAPAGSYVHSNRDTRQMMGGMSISFHGMVIQKTADAHEVVRIVAREIQKLQLQAA